jgi:hypothetical protein
MHHLLRICGEDDFGVCNSGRQESRGCDAFQIFNFLLLSFYSLYLKESVVWVVGLVDSSTSIIMYKSPSGNPALDA